jgi:hypothetical protein
MSQHKDLYNIPGIVLVATEIRPALSQYFASLLAAHILEFDIHVPVLGIQSPFALFPTHLPVFSV